MLDISLLYRHYIFFFFFKYFCNAIINMPVLSENSIYSMSVLPLAYPPFSWASGLGGSSPVPDTSVLAQSNPLEHKDHKSSSKKKTFHKTENCKLVKITHSQEMYIKTNLSLTRHKFCLEFQQQYGSHLYSTTWSGHPLWCVSRTALAL